jgi:arylamine N-acetyltransferase
VTEPFHNLYLLNKKKPLVGYGGTCSDKTAYFIAAARQQGFDAQWHTAFISGQEIHRLARIIIAGKTYFADVGNGWPALRLYPADREVSYHCFGMQFRTKFSGDQMQVFHLRKNKESMQMQIHLTPKFEQEILHDIENRFSSGIIYPFSNSLRFSLVVDKKFLFLRGNTLEIFTDSHCDVIEHLDTADLAKLVQQYFHYDLKPLLSYLQQ